MTNSRLSHCHQQYFIWDDHTFVDLRLAFQVLCKRDYAAEAEVQSWIESVLGMKFPEGKAYEDALKDGIILCRYNDLKEVE